MAALDEMQTNIADLRYAIRFTSLSARLRPRVGEIIDWNGDREAVDLVTRFMAEKQARPEDIFGGLLIRLIASLERYFRSIVAEKVDSVAGSAASFEQLPKAVAVQNIVLTSRLLSSIESPRDYLQIDSNKLIANLATCQVGNKRFTLNRDAFAAAVLGTTASSLDRPLQHLFGSALWDRVGASEAFADFLGTKGPRETGGRVKTRLEELSRQRNQLAHGGDAITVLESDIEAACAFVEHLAVTLHQVLLG